ncbi:MAG: hypothetical protein ACKOWF_14820 [Chloroflexota bacterium]
MCLRHGVLQVQSGDPAGAMPPLEEALAIAEARDRLVEKPVPLVPHALARIELGDLAGAAPELAAGLSISGTLGLNVVQLLALPGACRLLALRGEEGDDEAAVRLLGAALAASRREGIPLDDYRETRLAATQDAVAARLGPEAWERERSAGDWMTAGDAADAAFAALQAGLTQPQ